MSTYLLTKESLQPIRKINSKSPNPGTIAKNQRQEKILKAVRKKKCTCNKEATFQ